MKLKDGKFYLLDAGGEKRIYDDENDSAKALETIVSEKEDIDIESLNILQVNKAGEKWEVEPVPWSRIIMWENAKLRRKKMKPRLFNAEIRVRNSSL